MPALLWAEDTTDNCGIACPASGILPHNRIPRVFLFPLPTPYSRHHKKSHSDHRLLPPSYPFRPIDNSGPPAESKSIPSRRSAGFESSGVSFYLFSLKNIFLSDPKIIKHPSTQPGLLLRPTKSLRPAFSSPNLTMHRPIFSPLRQNPSIPPSHFQKAAGSAHLPMRSLPLRFLWLP